MRREKWANPLIEIDVEFVEGDVSGGDQDLLNIGIDSLEHGEVEEFCAVLVQIRHQFTALRHVLALRNPKP